MICYDKNGAVCKYCKPTTQLTGNLYGMPRYKCIHPLEHDDPIDPDRICTCPDNYKIK